MFLYIQIINFNYFYFPINKEHKKFKRNKNIFNDLILCAQGLQAFKWEIL